MGCQADAPPVDAGQESTENDLAAIQAQALNFSAAYVAGDIEKLISIYTENGMAAPGGLDFIVGRADLKPFWSPVEGRSILRHKTISESLVIDGDHAYDWGYYEGQGAEGGEPGAPFEGKYVIVWERGGDGVWRMAADMWNSMPAPPSE